MSKRVESDILIIGAGPVGLFTVFEAGLLGLNCQIIDNLDRVGGQCAELYPDKPIFDIPGVPYQTAEEHIGALLEQIKPFKYGLHLNQRVQEINQIDSKNEIQKWKVVTSENTEFIATNVFIAAGGGSFEPRRPPNIIDPDKFLNNGVAYSVKDKSYYQNKNLIIFGGGDSALDWSVELADIADSITLIHRRDAFRGSPGTEAQMRN
jgi:thioredoxin reductase (NADPH)